VDIGEAGLAVLDYKSGSSTPKRADFDAQRVLQVPLYAAVASKLLGRPVVAGLYRSLKTGASRGFFLRDAVDPVGLVSTDGLAEPGQVEALIAAAVASARGAADGIRAGLIEAAPASSDACEYCAAACVCRRGA
jgi:RecB family exonuclease